MSVVIVGAGIGGLATALSLHAAGMTEVVIAEAAAELRPLGVGINLLPHAVRELAELGLSDQLAGIGVATGELAYHNRYGSPIWSEPRGLRAGYRWPQFSVHRGRLQMLLLAEVRRRLGEAAVRPGHTLTGFHQEGGTVSARFATAGGETELTGEVLIGADGIHSALRALLYPDEGPPPWNGLVLWRGVSRARPFLSGRSMIMAGDGTAKFVAYPIQEAAPSLVNWIAERPMDEAVARGDWNRPVEPAEVLRHFGDWRFDWLDVPGLISAAEAVYEYPMVDRDPLPRWSHGRVTLLGDAAHAMYPIGSNGASQAVLDARVLAYELAVGRSPEQALCAYEERRRPVTTALCLANRSMGPEVVMRIAHERAPGGFTDIEDVIPAAEREGIAAAYKRTAGFDPRLLNERPSYGVAPA
ncbi:MULTISPECIES: flavin-dependent oxidoreductase [Streptosporangium]|uniref:2-polyprenyl-6-methoxyphenol hydroxylase-like FAD-dependent oxidoreductase n=1 Tax=Streptosporangium brasiliense TaxID=47480 RepID=A0ABT9RD68_9ACTN|nr:flavin-dependent oxidoreductase [Streptosporangium brasiliense]MDP9867198.1 2-polyprenyl-6-methoxyphenol hydroxylase-like FAD-dependent oxidoreductase [Streptosporangium brasiliense]